MKRKRSMWDMRGEHHNPFFPAGFPAQKKAMLENHTHFPGKRLEVKNVISDGDLVAVHSYIVLYPEDSGIVAVHLFSFQGVRIVEIWDYNQPVPMDSPNIDGIF